MRDQPQLDLPAPAARRPAAPLRGFGGFTRTQLVLGALVVAALAWSMWVTRSLVAPKPDHIVKARLSNIVGEYVSAQARSASPPAQVQAEMRAFMASLDRELERRGANGQVVLVGEAVLTRNVPDITDSLRKAVYASGIPAPRQASAEELRQLPQQVASQRSPQLTTLPPAPGSSGTVDPAAPVPAAPPLPTDQSASGPGASVSSFGGPGGDDGR